MSEPARVHKLHEHRTLSPEAQDALVQKVEETDDENRALRTALTKSDRTIKALRREIDDLLEEAADGDTVRTCLEFWIKITGRDPKKTKITLSGGRARDVRWVIRTHGKGRKGAAAFCYAVIGLCCSDFHVNGGYTDVKHLCRDQKGYDEGKLEKFIQAGKTLKGVA